MIRCLGHRLRSKRAYAQGTASRASRSTKCGAINPKATSSLKRRTNWPREVSLVEVGPRDGLQNEPSDVPTPVKVSLLQGLNKA